MQHAGHCAPTQINSRGRRRGSDWKCGHQRVPCALALEPNTNINTETRTRHVMGMTFFPKSYFSFPHSPHQPQPITISTVRSVPFSRSLTTLTTVLITWTIYQVLASIFGSLRKWRTAAELFYDIKHSKRFIYKMNPIKVGMGAGGRGV